MGRQRDEKPNNGDEILQSILGRKISDGRDLERLIDRFHRGYSLDNLALLLSSSDSGMVSNGAYVLAELGVKGRPLLGYARSLTRHADAETRYWALESLLACTSGVDAEAVADALLLVDDPSERVRWKALDFLVRADLLTLRSALPLLQQSDPSGRHARGLKLLLTADLASVSDIERAISAHDVLLNVYGVAAASRLAQEGMRLIDGAAQSQVQLISAMAKAKHPYKP